MAEVSPLVLDRLALAHHLAFTRVVEAAIAAVVTLWMGLDSVSDEETWEAGFWSVIEGAGRVSAYEATAYLQAQSDYSGIAPRFPTPNIEWLREDFDGWARAPLAKVTERLAREPDTPYEVIVRETVPLLRKLTDTALRTVELRTVDELVASPQFDAAAIFETTRPDEQFRPFTMEEARALAAELNGKPATKTFQRVIQAGACGWCQVVASRLYSHGAGMRDPGWHDGCRCTWREVTPEEAGTFQSPLAGQDYREVITERASVEISETGDIA